MRQQCHAILRILDTKEPEQRSKEEARQVKEHLGQCPACREHQSHMRLASEVMRHWEVPEASPQLAMKLLAQLDQHPQVTTPASWVEAWNQSRWFPVAALAAFAMSILLMVGSLSLPVRPPGQDQALKQHLSLLQGPSLKVDELTIVARSLGIENE